MCLPISVPFYPFWRATTGHRGASFSRAMRHTSNGHWADSTKLLRDWWDECFWGPEVRRNIMLSSLTWNKMLGRRSSKLWMYGESAILKHLSKLDKCLCANKSIMLLFNRMEKVWKSGGNAAQCPCSIWMWVEGFLTSLSSKAWNSAAHHEKKIRIYILPWATHANACGFETSHNLWNWN